MASICRPGCGACCIAPSISTPLPGMPEGKPAGVPCIHLLADRRCGIFLSPERPPVCSAFQPEPAVCGSSADEAIALITWWESATA